MHILDSGSQNHRTATVSAHKFASFGDGFAPHRPFGPSAGPAPLSAGLQRRSSSALAARGQHAGAEEAEQRRGAWK
mgnify:CR=1 FL=1